MKQVFIVLFAGSLLAACNAADKGADTTAAGYSKEDSARRQQMLDAAADSANFTSIQWVDSLHQDLGKVSEGAQVAISWRFKNTGTKPLIISQVAPSCGCTVAEKPEAPIAPGAEGVIKGTFDSKGKPGTNNKDMYVTANTSGSTQHQLSFTVDVQNK